MITTLLEMTFANTKGGLEINLDKIKCDDLVKVLFAENPGVIIQVDNRYRTEVKKLLEDEGIGYVNIGQPCSERHILVKKGSFQHKFDIDSLRDTWYGTSHLLDGGKASTARPTRDTRTTSTSPCCGRCFLHSRAR